MVHGNTCSTAGYIDFSSVVSPGFLFAWAETDTDTDMLPVVLTAAADVPVIIYRESVCSTSQSPLIPG